MAVEGGVRLGENMVTEKFSREYNQFGKKGNGASTE
jgi:hypothetical protein